MGRLSLRGQAPRECGTESRELFQLARKGTFFLYHLLSASATRISIFTQRCLC